MGAVGAARMAECWWEGAGVASGQPVSFVWWHFGICVRVLCECRARDNTPGGWGREGVRADLNSLPSLRVWALGPQGRSPRWVLVQPSLPTFCFPALDGHPQGLACAAPSP